MANLLANNRPPRRLNRTALNRHRLHYVDGLREVLHQFSRIQRSPEALQAADDIEQALIDAILPPGADYAAAATTPGKRNG